MVCIYCALCRMPSCCAKLLSLCVDLLGPAVPATFPPTWLTQRLQQPLDLVLRYMRCDCSILESSFLDQLQPMDLLALQADWVDDHCLEEEGLGEHEQEGINDKSLADDKKAPERFPRPSMHSHLDGHNVPA